MGRIAAMLLLLGAGGAVWYWWPEISAQLGRPSGVSAAAEMAPSEQLAAQAEEKLLRMNGGATGDVILSGAEIESLLLYRFSDRWPRGVSAPSVEMREGELVLGLQVSRDALPRLPDFESLLSFLPDTVPVQLRGRVLALGTGEAALMVHRLDASAVPIPRRLFPLVLSHLQGSRVPGVPPEAILLPLPEGVRSLRIDGSSLVISPAS
jgi:hypothetical protein